MTGSIAAALAPLLSEDVHVHVTEHALSRLAARNPGVGMRGAIKREVVDALRAGRVSVTRPTWLPGARPVAPECLFLWPEGRERVYVAVVNGRGLAVLTTLIRALEAAVA